VPYLVLSSILKSSRYSAILLAPPGPALARRELDILDSVLLSTLHTSLNWLPELAPRIDQAALLSSPQPQ
jgi:hypothetical protein